LKIRQFENQINHKSELSNISQKYKGLFEKQDILTIRKPNQ